MTGEPPHIDYEALAQTAMRGLVRSVLEQTAKSGLPGEHHFYISFDTCADNVSLSPRLKEKYPTEMTIVLQHRFRDLSVNEDGFEVKLTFDGIPERLVVPFKAIKVFFDPSVRYGLQFEDPDAVNSNQDAELHPFSGTQGRDGNGALRSGPELVGAITQPIESDGDGATIQVEPDGDNVEPAEPSNDGQFDDEPTVLDTDEVASATEGAQILRLDAFRKK